MSEKKDNMLKALSTALGEEVKSGAIVIPAPPEVNHKPSENTLIKSSEEDFEYTRANVKKLIETSDEAIATMMNLASDSEHPRAFEVLANLIKTASDINQQLITLNKDRKKLIVGETKKDAVGVTNNTTNNAIFVGTTDNLQKYLKTRDAAKAALDAEEV